ncbi:hypothetical protein TNCV_2830801 [Trichonephila clavipes]|nr:hypothetical protein TNCV_2830801 [Trichonephila clavipes]
MKSGYEKVSCPYAILQKDIYPLRIIVGSNGKGIVLLKEYWFSGGHGELMRGKTAVFDERLWRIVLRLRQKIERQLVPH